ncbi:MAG: hypothetical protein ACO29Z_04290 [Crocinitomicaceae bacterium]|jgi:hypothetical protein
MTPEEITILLQIAKHCLQEDEQLSNIAFEMNIAEEHILKLREKLIAHLNS